ncbi:hypothetical protein KBB85_04030 [Patescibacteria group bacterium]|nr:hypothetical protein [Patescibacteria group bacterium]
MVREVRRTAMDERNNVEVVILDPTTRGKGQRTEHCRGFIQLRCIPGALTPREKVEVLRALKRNGANQSVMVHPRRRGASPHQVKLVDLIIDPDSEFTSIPCPIPYEVVVEEPRGMSKAEFRDSYPDLNTCLVVLTVPEPYVKTRSHNF